MKKTMILFALLMLFSSLAIAFPVENTTRPSEYDGSSMMGDMEEAESHYLKKAAYFRNEAEFHRIMKNNAAQWSDGKAGSAQFIQEHCDSIIRDLESLASKMDRFAEFYGQRKNSDTE